MHIYRAERLAEVLGHAAATHTQWLADVPSLYLISCEHLVDLNEVSERLPHLIFLELQ